MKFQNGLLYFPKEGEYDIPEEFRRGATIVLKLNK